MIWGRLGFRPRLAHPELKMGPHFPAKSAEIIVLYSIFGPPGILHRIHRIHYFPPDPAETGHSQQNGPWVPHAGEQDDGSLHKLLQNMPSKAGRSACAAGSPDPQPEPKNLIF